MDIIQVALIPKIFDVVHIDFLFAVYFFKKISVNLFTVSLTFMSYLQNIKEEIFLACKKIYKVSNAVSVISCAVNMNMDSSAILCSGDSSCFSDSANHILEQFYVLVFKNGSYNFNSITFGIGGLPLLVKTLNA